MLYLPIFILTADGTTGSAMTKTWCQGVWHQMIIHTYPMIWCVDTMCEPRGHQHCHYPPSSIWLRYVEDTFVIQQTEHSNQILQTSNRFLWWLYDDNTAWHLLSLWQKFSMKQYVHTSETILLGCQYSEKENLVSTEMLQLFYDDDFAVVIFNTEIMLVINCKDVSFYRFIWPH